MHVPCKCYSNCAIASSALPIIMALYKLTKAGRRPDNEARITTPFPFHSQISSYCVHLFSQRYLRLLSGFKSPPLQMAKYGVFYVIPECAEVAHLLYDGFKICAIMHMHE